MIHAPASPGRRRLLQIAAATVLLPTGARAGTTDLPVVRWRGRALGAEAQMILHGLPESEARQAIAAVTAELARLEPIFSLYRADSALVRLNRTGRLEAPPFELLQVLARARVWSAATGGAFDVTVQPLWALYRDHFMQADADPAGPAADAVAAARALIDWRAVSVEPDAIRLEIPGMALTLNGIAQGAITDRIATLLRRRGLNHVLIDLGEIRALGARPDGAPFRVGLDSGGADGPGARIVLPLADAAIATSASTGSRIGGPLGPGHVLSPTRDAANAPLARASVIAAQAIDADALSTALLAMSRPAVPAAAPGLGIREAILFPAEGPRTHWRA